MIIISSKCNLFSPWYGWKIVHLALNNNHSHTVVFFCICNFQLNRVMPPRTVGYPWSLIYSTERHGFSLKTMYRHMHHIDSPILLVVKDSRENVSFRFNFFLFNSRHNFLRQADRNCIMYKIFVFIQKHFSSKVQVQFYVHILINLHILSN
jgi:hypothetical protein